VCVVLLLQVASMRVLIVGAGGHGQVAADILLRCAEAGGRVELVGFVDENPSSTGRRILGIPVIGTVEHVTAIPHDALVIAVGDNAARARLFQAMEAAGEEFATLCHPAAVVSPDAQVGPGCMICAGVVVGTGSVIGADVILNTACTVDHHNRIDDHSHIAPGVHLGGDVTVGIGALIGIGAVVMPSRRVGDWSVVGAGALVHRNVPSRVTVAGVPAKVLQNEAIDRR
jgi:sugar O-acyltransferase (sialic acid O-acetyltransferase NeuD family)